MRLLPLAAAALLSGLSTSAMAQWSEARTKHFIIYSEQKPDDLRAYAERLEHFDGAVRAIRKMDDTPLTDGGKLTLYLLPSVKAFQKVYGGETSVLGVYFGRAEGSVALLSFRASRGNDRREGITPEHVFQHEYLHHLQLADQRTPLSPWVTEGTAEFFGTAEVDKDGSVTIGAPPQVRGFGVVSDMGFNAEQLLASTPAKTPEERESVYGKGWVMRHMMAFDPVRSKQFDQYLLGMAAGKKPLDSARAAFGDLKQLDKDLDRYARSNFKAVKLSPGPRPQVQVRTLGAGESAIMMTRIRSERGVNKNSAPEVAAEARRIAAAYPTNAFVQGTLAEAEFDVSDYAATIAAADRALAADPNNVQAMVYKGRALMELAKADKAKADWAEVRKWFIKANRADVENGEPLWLFYQSFEAAGQAPTKSAIDGLYYAQALVPQDRNLRGAAVTRLLKEDKPAEAEAMFSILVYDPHLPLSAQPLMTSILERIKARDSKGALAIMEADRAKQSVAATAATKS